MLIKLKKYYSIERIITFNKLMIETSNSKKNKFTFEGKHYKVYSNDVCVQTLINGSFLYRIFIDNKNNILVSRKLSKYLRKCV